MTTTAAPPVDLLRAVFDADRRGTPTLPPYGRPPAVRWLRRALIDFAALEQHLGLLADWSGTRIALPRPRRDAGPGEAAPPAGAADRLPDDRVVAVADHGPEALTDPELARLLVRPYALFDLYDVIDELTPEWWTTVLNEDGPPPPAEPVVPARPADRRPRAIWPMVAAGLLFGATAGGLAVVGLDRAGGGGSAGLVARRGDVRGPADPPVELTVSSSFDGFAAAVLLPPGRPPVVLPGFGAGPVRVGPASAAVLPPQPAADGVPVLAVVTDTPAAEVIRAAVAGWSGGDAAALDAYLRRVLADHHYRRVATAAGTVPPRP